MKTTLSTHPSDSRLRPVGATASVVPTIFHIEDDYLWTGVTAGLLDGWPEILHLGSATNGRDGITLCREKQPAIVLLDLGLPDMNGFEVLACLNALPIPPQVLLLTGRMDEALLYRLCSDGVAGLICKAHDFARHLRPALAAVAAGKPYFPREVRETLCRFRGSPDAFFKILSRRELELVSLLGRGLRDGDSLPRPQTPRDRGSRPGLC